MILFQIQFTVANHSPKVEGEILALDANNIKEHVNLTV